MLRKTLLALAAFALALPAYPAVRLTYQLNGVAVPVSWQSSAFPLRYAVDRRVLSARPGMESIINRALAEWTDVDDANLTFAAAGVVDGAKAGKDGQNSITIADDLFKDQHFLAVTTNWYDDKGYLSEADIQLVVTARKCWSLKRSSAMVMLFWPSFPAFAPSTTPAAAKVRFASSTSVHSASARLMID